MRTTGTALPRGGRPTAARSCRAPRGRRALGVLGPLVLLLAGLLPTRAGGAAASSPPSVTAPLPSSTPTGPLTRCAEIHHLLPGPGVSGIPVRLRGQIVYANPEEDAWLLRDSDSGITLVRPPQAPALRLGDLVDVEGVTHVTRFAMAVEERSLQVVGHAPLPVAPPVSTDQLINVLNDPRWVMLEALVEGVRHIGSNTLEVVLAGPRDTRALIPGFPPERPAPEEWIDGLVRLEGSWVTETDDHGRFEFNQLLVPTLDHARLISPRRLEVSQMAVQPVSRAIRFSARHGESRRIKVRGTVTAFPGGSIFYLQDTSAGIRIHSRTTAPLSPGDDVEVVGFPGIDGATPQIEESQVHVLGRVPEPMPLAIEPSAAGFDVRSTEAVLSSLEAETVAVTPRQEGAEIVVRAGNRYLSAHLPKAHPTEAFQGVKPGSRVRLTGVCMSVPGNSTFVGPLQLLLRTPADIRVVQREPWWTTPRAAAALAGFIAILLYGRVRASRDRLRVEDRYRNIFVSASELIAVHAPDGQFIEPNPAWTKLLGMSAKAMATRRVQDLVEAADRPRAERWWTETLAGKAPPPLEVGLHTPAGRRIRIELRGSPMQDNRNRHLVETIGSDLTERWEADQKRRELASIVEHSNDAIIAKTIEGTITSWNRAAERMFGYTREEIIGRPMLLLFPPSATEEHARILAAIRAGEVIENPEAERIHKDGRLLRVSSTISPLRDENGTVVGASKIARDVSRVLELEGRLRQAQKMEAVGMLAGGVAHDFNNILSSIILQTELMRETPALPQEALDDLDQIHTDAQRAADLTHQLLLFGRRQAILPCPLDLNEVLSRLLKMLQRLIREDIDLEVVLAKEPLWTHADRGMVEQVIINLTVNARDALPEGGRVVIETLARTVSDHTPAPDPDVTPGSYVGFCVRDNGAGIAPEVLPRIFEPFFTTKGPGHGTGLGLATVFGIVKQHRGWISVAAQPGQGAAFEVLLPAVSGQESPPPVRPTPGDFRGTETILLVEDEPAVRRATSSALRRHGYTVVEATQGAEALERFAASKAPIDLVLTDLVMPGGMGGRDLAARLVSIRPGLKVVFMSGYSLETAGRELKLGPREAFLQKPFETQSLLETLRTLLDARSSD